MAGIRTRLSDPPRFDSVAAVFAVDAEQRIVSATPMAAAILGIRSTDTRPCYEVMRALDGRNAPQCRPDCAEMAAARRGRIPRGSALWEPGCDRSRAVTTVVETREGAPSLIIHVLADSGPAGATRATHAPSEGLTSRQIETLRLLARGVTPREIARTLEVRPITVRNHIQTAMERLGAHSRLEAVMIASRAGLL